MVLSPSCTRENQVADPHARFDFPASGKMQFRSPVLTLHVVIPVSSSLRQTRIGSGIVVLWHSCLHVCIASWHPAGSHLQYAVTPSSVILQHTAQMH